MSNVHPEFVIRCLEGLKGEYMVMCKFEYQTLLTVIKWYMEEHPNNENSDAISKTYNALTEYIDTDKYLRFNDDMANVSIKALQEYIDKGVIADE